MYLLKLISVIVMTSVVGPYSQAILSSDNPIDMNHHGYQCHFGFQHQAIIIRYQKDNDKKLSCYIDVQKNASIKKTLWSARRNLDICPERADALATRLEDRGWECQSATLPAVIQASNAYYK